MNLVINLNKPSGMTSQQAVTRVKRILGQKKAGHTGTLDPLATGVLLVCLGEATKISRFLLEMDKRYEARIKLGEKTDTYDSDGQVTEKKDISFITGELVKEAVMGFRGKIEQVPPMYSAIKMSGMPLYTLARKGISIERESRKVEIFQLDIHKIDLPYVDLCVSCSKGTYIRTLCDDIGNKLGVGAHLVSLSRSAIGPFDGRYSLDLEDLVSRELVPDGLSVYSPDDALSGLAGIVLSPEEYVRARNGMKIQIGPGMPGHDTKSVKLKGPDGSLFGIGRIEAGFIHVERNLNL
ncbi:MAG: tRNA pseudouridine(55) synthase TruB [Nitrospirae bacterium]|nr:tRNA pseudouridine(55) synthase TruB [Nitrospirota bacterium]